MEDGGLEDRAEHDTLVYEALDPVQQGLPLLAVALLRLLLEEIVDVGIAAGGVRRAVTTKDSRRTAVLPGAVEAAAMTPPSFFDRHASMTVARSMLRTRVRMPTVAR